MKKTFKSAMLIMATAALSVGFASCDSNDDPDNGTVVNASDLKSVSETYINDVVYPTYKDLADYCKVLNEACTTLYQHAAAGTWSQSDIDAACEAFKNARREWERSEAFLYGAASDNEIDPHIDSWPLDHKELVSALNDKTLLAGIHAANADKFVYEHQGDFESVIGFHGLEFVLFRDGANRTVDALKTTDTEEGMTSVNGIDELAFAAAVSGDIRNMTSLLYYGWTADATTGSWLTSNCKWVVDNTKYKGLSPANIGYGQFVLNATGANAYFQTWQETLENVLKGGCSNICQEVYTQKLGQAYNVATTGVENEDQSADYIESPYSKRSFIDYQDNIYSIKNVLYGTRDITATAPEANSLMTIMKDNGYTEYAALSTALDEAIAALQTAIDSKVAFIDAPGHARVKTCIDKINKLDDELNNASTWFRKLKTK